jgi:hypothetical protein
MIYELEISNITPVNSFLIFAKELQGAYYYTPVY